MSDINQTTPILISIIPSLVGGKGHIIPYHTSVGQAAKLIGWRHVAAIAPDPDILDLPSNWHPCLSGENLELKNDFINRRRDLIIKTFQLPLLEVYKFGTSIARYLQQILPSTNHKIIFIERFIDIQLLALLFALCIVNKKKLSVWVLYRMNIHQKYNCWIYKRLNQAIKQILEPGKFHLLTDSETLSKSLSNYFNETVTVMPIPHTEFIDFETIQKTTDEIICWWPGSPRPEKGWEIVRSLINVVFEEATTICVVAAKSSGFIPILGGVRVQLVPHTLTRLEYLKWLKTIDIILLPYNAKNYSERTSGIFTECIIAGKIPVVTAGTWMAKELSRYDILELILDWNQPDITWNNIINLSKSLTVKEKIKQMQRAYQKFHNVESFALQMKNLFETSLNGT